MAPPAALITPPPVVPLHRRADYIPASDQLSSAYTWKGRPHNEWDLPYFPLWNSASAYDCPNVCLWGGHDSVDNYLYCQNNKSCVCKPSKLSTGVVFVSKCVETRCKSGAPGDAVGYVQTILTEFCGNAWREEGLTNVEFVIPRTGALVSTLGIEAVDPGPTSATPNSTPDSPAPSATDSPSSSNSTGSPSNIALKAGLGAGIPVAILLIVAIIVAVIYRRRYRRARAPPHPQEVPGDIPIGWRRPTGSTAKGGQVWMPPLPPVEISGRRTPEPRTPSPTLHPSPAPPDIGVKVEEERRRSYKQEEARSHNTATD